MKPISHMAFYLARRTPTSLRVLQRLQELADTKGIRHYDIKPSKQMHVMPLEEGTELVLCLSGDGTMLSMVRQVIDAGAILAGVNLGHLGFLSACGKNEVELLLDSLADGSYQLDERSLLEITQQDADKQIVKGPIYALNEVSLMRAQTGKMIDLDVFLDGKSFNRYHADGILVSTPTGSTAYSLSAGGPLIWPNAQVVCLTPICPHSLTNRSVVLPQQVAIRLKPRERRGRAHETINYSLDGRHTHQISLNESLCIRQAEMKLRLLSLPGSSYAQRLRAKLGW